MSRIGIYIRRTVDTKTQNYFIKNLKIKGKLKNDFIIPLDWIQENFPSFDFSISVVEFLNEDHDSDLESSYSEFISGTDPNDKNSVFEVIIFKNGDNIELTWNSFSNRIYSIEAAASMNFPFIKILEDIEATPPKNTAIVSNKNSVQFFRVKVKLK
jgi:hypothetical protein